MNSKFTLITRKLFAVLLIIFGSNSFLYFIPLSFPGGTASYFVHSARGLGYIFPIAGALEIIVGIMLLMKIWDSFALLLIAPITINILLFHLFLNIPGLSTAIVIVALNGILIYKHRSMYSPLFL